MIVSAPVRSPYDMVPRISVQSGRAPQGRWWPLYGEHDEVYFPYRPNRNHEHVASLLGGRPAPGTVLHTDGYAAYESYAKAAKITHAQCWAHARRELFEATEAEPERAKLALEHIAGIYAVEDRIRERGLLGDPKREKRVLEGRPRVEAFFAFVDEQFAELGLKPATPFTKALGYVRDRKQELSVFLTDPCSATILMRVRVNQGDRLAIAAGGLCRG
jgi:transposase